MLHLLVVYNFVINYIFHSDHEEWTLAIKLMGCEREVTHNEVTYGTEQ